MLQRALRTASQPSAGNPCPHAVISPSRPGPRLSLQLSFTSSGGQSWRGKMQKQSLGWLYVGIGDIDGNEGTKAGLLVLA